MARASTARRCRRSPDRHPRRRRRGSRWARREREPRREHPQQSTRSRDIMLKLLERPSHLEQQRAPLRKGEGACGSKLRVKEPTSSASFENVFRSERWSIASRASSPETGGSESERLLFGRRRRTQAQRSAAPLSSVFQCFAATVGMRGEKALWRWEEVGAQSRRGGEGGSARARLARDASAISHPRTGSRCARSRGSFWIASGWNMAPQGGRQRGQVGRDEISPRTREGLPAARFLLARASRILFKHRRPNRSTRTLLADAAASNGCSSLLGRARCGRRAARRCLRCAAPRRAFMCARGGISLLAARLSRALVSARLGSAAGGSWRARKTVCARPPGRESFCSLARWRDHAEAREPQRAAGA